MRIFLTGGTGLLGSHFAELALAEGARVVALVRPTSDTAFLNSLGGDISCSTGDLLNVRSLAVGMQGCDAVVHAASPLGGWGAPKLYEDLTIAGTRNVLAAMEAGSVKTLIYISTVSVHGLDPVQGSPVSEASGFGSRFLPYDHYGRAKVTAEKAVAETHAAGKIQATILRPGWIYGPRDRNSYGRLADMMRRGIAMRIGKGDNQIGLVYAGNVALAVWAALIRPSPACRVYLCASDGRVTQNQYLQSLARATGAKRRPISLSRSGLLALGTLQEHLSIALGYRLPVLLSRYIVHLIGSDWSFDQSRIEQELGYCPATTYQQGFAATEQWYREIRSLS
jgi:nucleoside-diphosphate-sugar epimerase